MLVVTPSIFLLLATVVVIYKKHPGLKSAYFSFILLIVSALLYGAYYVANFFTGVGIDESVLFHVRTGLDGAGASEYQGLIVKTFIYLAVASVSIYWVFKIIKKKPGRHSSHNAWYIVIIVLATASLITNPSVRDMYHLNASAFAGEVHSSYEEFPKEFISNSPSIYEKKNIVYLYLESVEATYLDESLFPGLMPNIKELQQSATSFSNIRQVTHTGWTIAGMTASQCGVPLFSPSHGNSLDGLDKFLPEANCIGDILKKNGYQLSYVAGAELSFSGKGNFYNSHGFDSVRGKNELSKSLSNPEYMSGWGLYDDSLYAVLKREYSQLSRSDSPFALFALTLDTHHPNGHTSKSCEDVKYKDGSNPILNSVHCADMLVRDFVDFVQNNPSPNGTVIAVSSDHYAMKNAAIEQLRKGERRNLLMVLDSDSNGQGRRIEKQGSMLDVAPTLLSFLGTSIEGLGFGRNLNSEIPSLVETKDDIDSYLKEQEGVVKYLWSYPELDKGLAYSSENEGQLQLGERKISIPAIIKIDNNASVDEVIFANVGKEKLVDYIDEMEIGQDFIWADRCELIGAFAQAVELDVSNADWCIGSGTAGANKINTWSLTNGVSISQADIQESITRNGLAEETHEKRVARALDFLKYGVASIKDVSISDESGMTGSVIVQSAGYGSGRSFIEQGGMRMHFKRGLTLVGLRAGEQPVKLSYIDSCGGSVAEHNVLDRVGDFPSVIEDFSGVFQTFLIIGHDSVVCGDPEFLKFALSETPLEKWSNIGIRQPYVATISTHGGNKEFLGKKGESLIVRVRKFSRRSEAVEQRTLDSIERVAHAGGGYNGKTYTNSLEALEQNKKNYSLFEIDLSWTSDNELVCIHDWKDSFERSFGIKTESAVSYKEFTRLLEDRSDVEKCTLSSLVQWLKDNPKKRIVTDIKSKNAQALELIAERYPELRSRFVPQVYNPQEYHIARSLGFDDVIWTLYRFRGDKNAVLSHLKSMDLYGLTMPRHRAEGGLANLALDERGVRSYVHTINREEEYLKYLDFGVSEIYTDWLH